MSQNLIDGNGIQIKTYTDILSGLITQFQAIYGADINVASNTADGQMLNIFALSEQDILDLCVSIYDNFDPDQAQGLALDAISQYCGMSRKGGTYTQVQLVVTANQAITLPGMDTSTPFIVEDSNGNQFQLITSASVLVGDNLLNFQAVNIGFIQVVNGTITTIVTTTYGITAVNNPIAPYQIGIDQETDAQFRQRRQKSVAGPGQGWLQSLYAGLYKIVGLTEAVIYENITDTEDSDGVPGHSIWVIVNGGEDSDIGEAIYTYRNAGCGMFGGQSYEVGQTDGSTFTVYWDRSVQQELYTQFHVDVIGSGSYDPDSLKSYLSANYILGIYDPADVSSIIALVKAYNPTLVVSSCQVSANGSDWEDADVYPDEKINQFVLNAANITLL